ncbi:MAG: formate dehydrogenase subunit gamma [Hyphomicrobiaceae bacterium]
MTRLPQLPRARARHHQHGPAQANMRRAPALGRGRHRIARAGTTLRSFAAVLAVIVAATVWCGSAMAQSSSVRPPENAVRNATPGDASGAAGLQDRKSYDPIADRGDMYDTRMWTRIRNGTMGKVSIPDKKAGRLVQAEGEIWRNIRNGPLPRYGAWAMGGTLLVLALFFLLRGRIKLERGWSGRSILRFSTLERMSHWTLAVSFIILGLTGLNVLYGRHVLLPLLGKQGFASLTMLGKTLHHYVGFAFMVGLALTFVLWVAQNIPNRHDLVWLLRGGGIIGHAHPPAKKFNAGQKILFWLIMLGGLSISLTGLSLLMPFESAMFSKTFAFLNHFGFSLPTALTPLEEMQLADLWHAAMALVLTCVIFAHIYIGTLGMQGAFDAMSTGEVDANWAKEHHSIWADEVLSQDGAKAPAGTRPQPAE